MFTVVIGYPRNYQVRVIKLIRGSNILKEDKVVVDKISTNPDITIVAYNPKNTEVKKYSMTDILRDRLILTNSVIIWFLWLIFS